MLTQKLSFQRLTLSSKQAKYNCDLDLVSLENNQEIVSCQTLRQFSLAAAEGLEGQLSLLTRCQASVRLSVHSPHSPKKPGVGAPTSSFSAAERDKRVSGLCRPSGQSVRKLPVQ